MARGKRPGEKKSRNFNKVKTVFEVKLLCFDRTFSLNQERVEL